MKNKGFTLFELLVSISIIAILTAIATASFSGAQKKARDARRISDMNSVQKAAEQYYSFSNYVYPATTVGKWTATTNNQVFLEVFPVDPKNVAPLVYTSAFPANAYCFCAMMENAVGNASDSACGTFVSSGGAYYCVKNQQ